MRGSVNELLGHIGTSGTRHRPAGGAQACPACTARQPKRGSCGALCPLSVRLMATPLASLSQPLRDPQLPLAYTGPRP